MQRFSFVLALFLMLSLGACQAPGLNVIDSNHNASLSDTPDQEVLDTDQYAQAFNKIFDDYNRTQGKYASGMTLGAGSEDAVSSSLLLSPNPNTPTAMPLQEPEFAEEPSPSVSAMPVSADVAVPNTDALQSDLEQNSSAAFTEKKSEEIKKVMRFQIEATEKMEAQLKVLRVPADLQEKHGILLSYFSLSRDLSQAMMDEWDVLGPELMMRSRPPEAFEKKYGDKLERLKVLTPQAVDIMLEFQILAYRSERLEHQANQMLSEADYLEEIRQISPDLREFSIFSMMMSMSFGGSDSFDSGETKAKERLLALAKLHPPTEYEAAQTLMYALSKLQLDLIQMMKKHLTKDEKVRPEKIMLTLLSDQDFMLISMRLGVFMSKMDELSKTLSIFDAT